MASSLDEKDCVPLLVRGVAATLGEMQVRTVHERVAELTEWFPLADGSFVDRLVSDVQQRFHDEFVDTVWPQCPRHSNHPLWFKDGWWWCEKDNVPVVPLGSLADR